MRARSVATIDFQFVVICGFAAPLFLLVWEPGMFNSTIAPTLLPCGFACKTLVENPEYEAARQEHASQKRRNN